MVNLNLEANLVKIFGLEFLTFLVWYKVAFANFGKDWDKIISVSLRLLSVVSIY